MWLFGARITHELCDLADAVDRISQHFGWTAARVDRELSGAPGTIANSHDALANLAASLESIRRRAARLAADVRDVGAGLGDPHPAASPATTNAQAMPLDRSPSVEL